MTGSDRLAARQLEFRSHVWNHSVDLFQVEFDTRPKLDAGELRCLERIVDSLRSGATEAELVATLRKLFESDPQSIYVLMQAVGLTRNKIVSDLKGALAGTSASVPGKAHLIVKRPDVWKLAGPYLASRLRTVLTPLIPAHGQALAGALEALNQATWPGWIRQERAKRQGHAAEGRLAVMLASLDLPFEPAAKADNPMCPDATVDGVSFDIVVPSAAAPGMCVKATVHTANIGQYGESKDHLEISEAREVLNRRSSPAVLVAFIDGVGFFSNRAGLDGVLTLADEFCQFKTLWKAAVVAASACGRKVALVLPDEGEHSDFLDRYSDSVELLAAPDERPDWIEAGEAQARPA